MFFLKEIKDGLIDMSFFFFDISQDESNSCILSSVFFGILYSNEDFNLKKSISYIKKNFKSLYSFETVFRKKYKIYSNCFLRSKSLTFMIDHISKRIKVDIIVLKKNKKKMNIMKLFIKQIIMPGKYP